MKALQKAGVSHFHMSEYESRKGAFADWPDRKRIAVIKRLTEIITSNAAHGVAAAVVVEDYKELVAGLEKTASPYVFCVARCLTQVAKWAKLKHLDGPIAYVFEAGAGYVDEVEERKAEIRSSPLIGKALRFHSLTFADKKRLIPLQAADVIAYETMKHCKNTLLLNSGRPPRKSLMGLLPLPHDGEYFGSSGSRVGDFGAF